MQQRRFRIWPALLVFGALLAFGAIAPTAVGATSLNLQFTTAGGQRVLDLSGSGFGPGEKITMVGLKTDNSTVNYPDAVGNPIGAFEVFIPYDSNVFRIKASGQLTGITTLVDVGPVAGTPPGFVPPYPQLGACYYFDTGFYWNSCPGASLSGGYGPGYVFGPGYTLVPGAGVPVPAPAPAPVPAPTSTAATVGTAVTITAVGFTPNETVSAWITAPDSSVTQIGSAPASADGTVSISVTFPSAGNWQVTAHGQTSGREVVNRYTVT
jgi:hypothetical protein